MNRHPSRANTSRSSARVRSPSEYVLCAWRTPFNMRSRRPRTSPPEQAAEHEVDPVAKLRQRIVQPEIVVVCAADRKEKLSERRQTPGEGSRISFRCAAPN